MFRLFRRAGPIPNVSEDEYLEAPPHGRILVVDLTRSTGIRGDAVSDRLMKFAGQPTPFVGVLINLHGIDYRFTSGDIASIAGTIAAWKRGWVAPCAIVIDGSSAAALHSILELTQLNRLHELRVVDTKQDGLSHILEQLARSGA